MEMFIGIDTAKEGFKDQHAACVMAKCDDGVYFVECLTRSDLTLFKEEVKHMIKFYEIAEQNILREK